MPVPTPGSAFPTPMPMPVPTPGSAFPTPMPMPVPTPGSAFPTPMPMPVPTPGSAFPTPMPMPVPTPGSAYPTPQPVPMPVPTPISSSPFPQPAQSVQEAKRAQQEQARQAAQAVQEAKRAQAAQKHEAAKAVHAAKMAEVAQKQEAMRAAAEAKRLEAAQKHEAMRAAHAAKMNQPMNPFGQMPQASQPQPSFSPGFPTPIPAQASFPVPMPVPMSVVSTLTQSNLAGKSHADTLQFDDYNSNKQLLGSSSNVRISELRVIHDNKVIIGIEVIYEADGQIVSGGMHCGKEVSHTAVNQAVQLGYGETITGITGKHGDVIDSMIVTTSTGTNYQFGGTGGSFNYSLYIPAGKTIKSFAGGTGGHLHNISCYYS